MVDELATAREHIARLIADLGRADAYPYPVDSIALEETHASLAFLAGDSCLQSQETGRLWLSRSLLDAGAPQVLL